MFEVFHTEWPEGSQMSNFYPTREGAEAHVASASGGKMTEEGFVETQGHEFLSIREVERESKPCRFCGGEVQATATDVDYCRGCFYAGRIFEDGVTGLLAALREHPNIDPDSVGVWHTGGGCFCVGANYQWDAGTTLEILTSREASVDEGPSLEHPWMIGLTDSEGEYTDLPDELSSVEDLVEAVDRVVAEWESITKDEPFPGYGVVRDAPS
jgi:hypothetical protein